MQVFTADVVVLGAGGAGLSAALAAAEQGFRVAVVSKVYPMRSHTVAAEGGAAGVHLPEDSLVSHVDDTLRAGAGLGIPDAVEAIVAAAPRELARLERWGMPFSRTDDGDVAIRPFGGMSHPRTWFAADKTGFHLLHTLFQTALQYPEIEFFSDHLALDLLRPAADGDCWGLLAYSQRAGEPVLFTAPALIIATGGFARAWGTSTNADIVTGDGHALALRAGLPLMDIEFIQWHPTCLPGTGFLITEAARAEGGVLRDKDGQRYLADYGLGPETPLGHPEARRMELGPRDALSQAFLAAEADGRTASYDYPTVTGIRQLQVVYLDLTHLGREVLAQRLPLIVTLANRYAGVDPARTPIPVCPAAHYTMGGIPTNASGSVLDDDGEVVPGLFAAGECAATGLHGANRLGSNSLVETLVMGRAAALAATEVVARRHEVNSTAGVPETEANARWESWARWWENLLKRQDPDSLAQIRADLGQILDQDFGIQVTDESLSRAANAVTALGERLAGLAAHDSGRVYNVEFQERVELENLLTCAGASLAAARERRESRGAFQNSDHPETAAAAEHSLVTISNQAAANDPESVSDPTAESDPGLASDPGSAFGRFEVRHRG